MWRGLKTAHSQFVYDTVCLDFDRSMRFLNIFWSGKGIHPPTNVPALFVHIRQVRNDFRNGVTPARPKRALVHQVHSVCVVVQARTDFDQRDPFVFNQRVPAFEQRWFGARVPPQQVVVRHLVCWDRTVKIFVVG